MFGDTNSSDDVFVHDRQAGTTVRVSVASDGTEGNDFSISPSISADGRYVVYSAPSALGSSSAQILRPREFSKAIQVCSVRKYQGWGAHESDIPLQSS